jgi:hypothetical protein
MCAWCSQRLVPLRAPAAAPAATPAAAPVTARAAAPAAAGKLGTGVAPRTPVVVDPTLPNLYKVTKVGPCQQPAPPCCHPLIPPGLEVPPVSHACSAAVSWAA